MGIKCICLGQTTLLQASWLELNCLYLVITHLLTSPLLLVPPPYVSTLWPIVWPNSSCSNTAFSSVVLPLSSVFLIFSVHLMLLLLLRLLFSLTVCLLGLSSLMMLLLSYCAGRTCFPLLLWIMPSGDCNEFSGDVLSGSRIPGDVYSYSWYRIMWYPSVHNIPVVAVWIVVLF